MLPLSLLSTVRVSEQLPLMNIPVNSEAAPVLTDVIEHDTSVIAIAKLNIFFSDMKKKKKIKTWKNVLRKICKQCHLSLASSKDVVELQFEHTSYFRQ